MEGLTLTGVLRKAAGEFPSRRAISVPGRLDLSHERLHQLVDDAAARLAAAGVSPGDVIALAFPNTVEVRPAFYCLGLIDRRRGGRRGVRLTCCFDVRAACDRVSGGDSRPGRGGAAQLRLHRG